MVKCIFGVMKISFNILFLPVFLQKVHLEIVSVSNEYSNETVSVFFIFLFFLLNGRHHWSPIKEN